jgi:hypothetical protein
LFSNSLDNNDPINSTLNDSKELIDNYRLSNAPITNSKGNTQMPFLVTHGPVFNDPYQNPPMTSTQFENSNPNQCSNANDNTETKTENTNDNKTAYNIHTEEDEDEFISSQFLTIEMNNTVPMSSNPLNNIGKNNHIDTNNNKTSRICLNNNLLDESNLLREAETALFNKRKLNLNTIQNQTPIAKKQRNFNFINKK